jgi:hypothetical protein
VSLLEFLPGFGVLSGKFRYWGADVVDTFVVHSGRTQLDRPFFLSLVIIFGLLLYIHKGLAGLHSYRI